MQEPLPSEVQFVGNDDPSRTTAGLLVTVVQKAQEVGFFETLLDGLHVKMKQVVYSHRNKLETLVASMMVGARHISAIQARLVPDTAAAALFGMARFPDQAQVNAFLHAMGPEQVAHLERAHLTLLGRHSRARQREQWVVLPDGRQVLPVDLDQTYLVTRSARAEGAARGYFGRKRGQSGYKKSLALLGGGVQEVLWQRLEPGNEHGQTAVPPLLERLRVLLTGWGIPPEEVLVRGDSEYGSTGCLRQYQAAGVQYVVSGYSPNTAHALVERLGEQVVWQEVGTDSNGAQVWVADAGEQELTGHDDPPGLAPVRTRVVLVRRKSERTRHKHGLGAPGTVTETVVSYEHYCTGLAARAATALQVLKLYDARSTEESFFRAEQDGFGAQYLRTHHRDGQGAFLWLLASAVNLLRWTQHSTLAHTPLEQVGLTRLVTEAMQVPATVVRTTERVIVILPTLARLVRQLVACWEGPTQQLRLPLDWGFNST